VAILSGDDRRRLIPQALVQVLGHLISDVDDRLPSHERAELRSLRSRICRLYKLPDPQALANDSDVAQAIAEEDGDPIGEEI